MTAKAKALDNLVLMASQLRLQSCDFLVLPGDLLPDELLYRLVKRVGRRRIVPEVVLAVELIAGLGDERTPARVPVLFGVLILCHYSQPK